MRKTFNLFVESETTQITSYVFISMAKPFKSHLYNICGEGECEDRREHNERFISSVVDMLVLTTTCFGHQVTIFRLYKYEEKNVWLHICGVYVLIC
jgi:hypothetical protein